jgi:hypothetical protein
VVRIAQSLRVLHIFVEDDTVTLFIWGTTIVPACVGYVGLLRGERMRL